MVLCLNKEITGIKTDNFFDGFQSEAMIVLIAFCCLRQAVYKRKILSFIVVLDMDNEILLYRFDRKAV